MIRLLLLLAILVVVVLLVRQLLARGGSRRDAAPSAGAPADASAETPPEAAKLVRCVECGAFVPKATALPVPAGFRCGGPGCAPR